MKHFRFMYVEAGNWSRLPGTGAVGGNNTRPHFIPITQAAENFIAYGMFVGFGANLCPGLVNLDGDEKLAFRFVLIKNPEENVPKMIAELDETVDRLTTRNSN